MPIHAEDYVHRIGRTGRAGRPGTAITIAQPDDALHTQKIETLIGRGVPRRELETVETANWGDRPKRRRRNGKAAPVETARETASVPEERPRRRPASPAAPERRRRAAAPPPDETPRPDTAFGEHIPAFLLRPGGEAKSA